ncbi:hypothetical protein F8388_020487 [Cannabis sativa]|uniref:Myb-like domain-containing protein n=1 Tax=Cannabis sativa TaxID=3483 RepID=A0A7J6EX21_CANSA|nr:hypothetical protein F8388_020487 [Cannabis sativa]
MASKIYTPSMKKSSVDLNLELSSTSVSVTQPANCVERLENVDLHNEEKPSQESKLKWSKEATILLISGWLNTIVGNDQISAKFWDQIAEYFNTNHKGEERITGKQCKDRWNKINQKVVQLNDDSDEIYFNKFIAGSSSTRRGKKRSHIDKGSCKRT